MISYQILRNFITELLELFNALWVWWSSIEIAGVGLNYWIIGFFFINSLIAVIYRIVGMPNNITSEAGAMKHRLEKSSRRSVSDE